MPKVEVLGEMAGPVAGYVTMLTRVHVNPGEQVPRHTHPGIESTYVLEGAGIVRVDGLPDKLVKAGDWFQVAPNVPHSVQIASEGALVVGNYVVEKDKPLTTWLGM